MVSNYMTVRIRHFTGGVVVFFCCCFVVFPSVFAVYVEAYSRMLGLTADTNWWDF